MSGKLRVPALGVPCNKAGELAPCRKVAQKFITACELVQVSSDSVPDGTKQKDEQRLQARRGVDTSINEWVTIAMHRHFEDLG